MSFDFFCIDEDGDDICVEAKTYDDAIRAFFGAQKRKVWKKHGKGYKVMCADGIYSVLRGDRIAQ